MENVFKIYDVFDNNNKLNSQVIFNSIGFEIPTNYYFEKKSTNLELNKFQLINDCNHKINLECYILNESEFNDRLKKYSNQAMCNFQNYRSQKIYEIIDNEKIKIIGYDGKIFFKLDSNVKKYSQEYFELYYVAFSLSEIENNNYDNNTYQKNNYCILKNGKYVYDKYNIDIVYEKPYECLKKLNTINFNNYINKNEKYEYELDNNYVKNNYRSIFEKIENYKKSVESNEELLDIVNEN